MRSNGETIRRTYPADNSVANTMTPTIHMSPEETAAVASSHFPLNARENGTPASPTPANPRAIIRRGWRTPTPRSRANSSVPYTCLRWPATRNTAVLDKPWPSTRATVPVVAAAMTASSVSVVTACSSSRSDSRSTRIGKNRNQ